MFEEKYDENYLSELNAQDEAKSEDEMEERKQEEISDMLWAYKCSTSQELMMEVIAKMSKLYTLDGVAKKLDLQDGATQIDNADDLMMTIYSYSDEESEWFWDDAVYDNVNLINHILKEAGVNARSF